MSFLGESVRRESAPDPDDPRKAPRLRDITGRTWRLIIRSTLRGFLLDQCIDSAASLTYFGVLAVFPALIAVLSLLGVVGQGKQTADALLQLIAQAAPSAASVLRQPIEQTASSPQAGVGLIVGTVLAVVTASGYISAFARAMNRIYETDEGRSYVGRKAAQLLMTLILVVLVALIVTLVIVSGPFTIAIGRALGLGTAATTAWEIVKWPAIALAAIAVLSLLYRATPNLKQPGMRWLTPGGIVALLAVVVASVGFAVYVADFSHYGKTYGSLAGVIVFLTWLWVVNLALMLGAEFDAQLERGREGQAGLITGTHVDLPPKSTTVSANYVEIERRFEEERSRLDQEGDASTDSR